MPLNPTCAGRVLCQNLSQAANLTPRHPQRQQREKRLVMRTHRFRACGPLFVFPLVLMFGCATTGGAGRQSSLERSINWCVVSVVAGAVFDIASKRGRPGAGMLTGAALCGVILLVNNKLDRERINQNQRAALDSDTTKTDTYTGSDGKERLIKTSVQPAPSNIVAPSAASANPNRIVGPCRRTQTDITVQGHGTVNLDPEVVCRTAQGDWVPWSQ